MDLIRVQCETCQSWLKVRGEGFLGEVHACPKCGGMVLIAAPPAEPTETRADAPTPGPPAMLGMSNTLEETEAPTDASAPPTETTADAAAEPEPIEEATEPVAAAVTSWAPIATTALSLMATGAILAAWWVSGSDSTVATADPAEVTQSESPAEPDQIEPADAVNDPIGPSAELVETTEPDGSLDEASVAPPDEPVTPDFDLPPVQEATEPEPDPITDSPDEPLAEPIATTEPEPDTTYDNAPAVIDPLSLDPTEIELILRRGDSETTEPSGAEEATESPAADPAIEPAGPTLDERLAAAARRGGIYVQRGPTDATTGPPTLAAETALTRVVPSVDLREIPLEEAIRLLGKLAGTPITLDPLALQRAGVRPTRPIDLIGEGQTIGDLLTMALGKSRLTYATEGPYITVVRKGAAREREIVHRLADLAGDKPEELSDLLNSLLSTDRPLEVNAAGELKLSAPMGLHYDLLILCERLRAQRGLPTESKYPRDLLPPESPSSAMTSLLERHTTFSFVEPVPLTTVFDHWRRITKRPFLIDWRSLGDAGLGPQTTVVCSATNRPLQAALTGVLEPLGLDWTPAIGGSIWITTANELSQTIPLSGLSSAARSGVELQLRNVSTDPR